MGFSTEAVNKSRIDDQYNTLIQVVTDTFGTTNPDRAEKLIKLYTDYEERIKTAPASGRLQFHNAYEGGYLDHVLNVLQWGKMQMKLYEKMGGWVDFTYEELVFAILNHDLNKLGTLDTPHYVPQDSEWHRNKRLEVYKPSEEGQYWAKMDLVFFRLQEYGIAMTENEFLAIRLSHGMFDESNKDYLKQYNWGHWPMQNNLYKIVHIADYMASSAEGDTIRKKYTR